MSGLKKNEEKKNQTQKQNKKPSWRTKKQLRQEELGPIKLRNLTSNFVCQLSTWGDQIHSDYASCSDKTHWQKAIPMKL